MESATDSTTTGLAGKTALITGAGRGIGRALAFGLAAVGVRLVLLARSAGQLGQTARELNEASAADPLVVPADVGNDRQLRAAVAAAQARGPVDILVNNAASVEPLGPTAGLGIADIRRAFDVNVVAVIALSGALLPAMAEAGWGRIVNISSGIAGRPGNMVGGTTYAAAKAALEAHTINLAAELAGSGVTVNAYRPGSVDTAMQAWIRGQDPARIGTGLHDQFARSHASGALLSPERSAASLIARLGTAATGQIWDVADDSPAAVSQAARR
jgi:NAD(P)-dependent dehydrogenase (short-subunit alcohol dehydrogenase family)